MSRARPFLVVGTLAVVALSAGAIAAWSTKFLIFGGDGHKKLSELALAPERIPTDEYPDLHRFRSRLIDGSMSESGHPSFFGNHARDNKLDADWTETKGEYNALDFARAYRHIGIMGHLVQDHASPAHAFDIAHVSYQPNWVWPQITKAFLFGDNMEAYADDVFAPVAGEGPSGIAEPPQAYLDIIDRTQGAVNGNEDATPPWAGSPAVKAQAKDEDDNDTNGWRFYWRGKAGGPTLERQFVPFFGSAKLEFAGEYGPNEFPRHLAGPGRGGRPGNPGPRLVREYPPGWRESYYDPFMNRRLGDAIVYSAACWKAASRKLPPILIRHPSRLDGNTIEVIENRKKEVDLKFFINGVLSDDYDGAVDVLELAQDDPANPTKLPWRRVFPVTLPNLDPGHYTLRWEVRDIPDNNEGVPFEEPLDIGNIVGLGG